MHSAGSTVFRTALRVTRRVRQSSHEPETELASNARLSRPTGEAVKRSALYIAVSFVLCLGIAATASAEPIDTPARGEEASRQLDAIVVQGEITYRDRTDDTAPVRAPLTLPQRAPALSHALAGEATSPDAEEWPLTRARAVGVEGLEPPTSAL